MVSTPASYRCKLHTALSPASNHISAGSCSSQSFSKAPSPAGVHTKKQLIPSFLLRSSLPLVLSVLQKWLHRHPLLSLHAAAGVAVTRGAILQLPRTTVLNNATSPQVLVLPTAQATKRGGHVMEHPSDICT